MLGLVGPEADYMSDDWDLASPEQAEAWQAEALHAEEMFAENMHAEIMHSAATTPCCTPAQANSYSLAQVAAMNEVLQLPPDLEGRDLVSRLVLMATDSDLAATEPPDAGTDTGF
jgi:hypothetical protein